MMKRFFLLLLAFLCFLIPVGCGDPDSGQKPSEPTVPSEPEVPEKPAYQNAYLDKKDGLKILAIGNSFTYVSTQYLWEVLDDLGFTNVKVARLYIGGTSISQHAANFSTNASYSFDYKTGTKWRKAAMSAMNAVTSDEWDVITLQQQSADAGNPSSFRDSDFDTIVNKLNAWNGNENYTLAWLMTWAYETGCDYHYFAQYNNDQSYMYECIVNTTIEKIIPNRMFTQIIPLGTAVQNARTGQLGDELTMDGYHLNDLGDYIAAVCWAKAMTNCDLSALDYVPETLKDYENLPEIARICAERAVSEMFVQNSY